MRVARPTVLAYGTTGVRGAPVATRLLDAGYRLRVLVRDAAKATAWADAGASVFEGDLAEPESLARASAGADAVYLHLPLVYDPARAAAFVRNVLGAAEAGGVRRIVFQGNARFPAEPTEVAGFEIDRDAVMAVLASPLASVVLRPTVYMDNFAGPWTAPAIVGEGVVAYPISAEARTGFVSADDAAGDRRHVPLGRGAKRRRPQRSRPGSLAGGAAYPLDVVRRMDRRAGGVRRADAARIGGGFALGWQPKRREERAGGDAVILEVFHDTVCPWCRIGKRRLDDALAAWEGPVPEIRWKPFLLDDTVPPEGIDFRQYMAASKGAANVEPMFEAVRQAGAADGIVFRLDRVRFATNTRMSHRLIALAPPERQGAVVEAIHTAYFEEGRDIGNRAVLLAIADETGLDSTAIGADLADPDELSQIADEAAVARRMGIGAVPTFLFDGSLALGGAQPKEIILEAMGAGARESVGAR